MNQNVSSQANSNLLPTLETLTETSPGGETANLRTEVKVTATGYQLKIRLPKLSRRDFSVHASHGFVVIRGKLKAQGLREVFALPSGVVAEALSADYHNETLNISIPVKRTTTM